MHTRQASGATLEAFWKPTGNQRLTFRPDYVLPGSLQPTKRFLARVPGACPQLVKRFLYALVPQLIRTRYFNDRAPIAQIHATSWMNGLRGLASFAVFNEHYVYFFTYTFVVGWGASPKDKWIHQLPIIELFCDGVCGVIVFFSIAGYVCSYNTLRAITAGDHAGLFRTLPTSIFRRWFRLYLPVFCSTFCICTLAYLGAYEPTRSLFDLEYKKWTFPGPGDEPQPPRFSSMSAQFTYWWESISKIMNFWTEYPKDPPIDYHLWSIVYEYRASMHLYVTLVALAACRPQVRILILLFLGYIYVGRFSHWDLVCFFYGAAIAQMDILRLQNDKSSEREQVPPHQLDETSQTSHTDTELSSDLSHAPEKSSLPSLNPPFYLTWSAVRKPSRLHAIYWHYLPSIRSVLYLVALYLMSFPIRGVKYPSTLYRNTVIPFIPAFYGKSVGPKFPKQVGTLLLMYLLTTIPDRQRARSLWHRFLTCEVCQYLGRIMFGLYLIHGMVLHVFGLAIPHYIWSRWNPENEGDIAVPSGLGIYLGGLFVGWVVSLIVALWVADVWTREVEGRCVKFTKWLEGRLFVKR